LTGGSSFAQMLGHDRERWKAFGLMPGLDTLELLLDRLDGLTLPPCDWAFLFAAVGHVVAGEMDDDSRPNLEITLGELGAHLVKAAASGPIGPTLSVARVRDVTTTVLESEDEILCVANLDAGSGPARTLYVVFGQAEGPGVEVLVQAGAGCQIAVVADTREAIRLTASWLPSSDKFTGT
jgi:hypothetical protein